MVRAGIITVSDKGSRGEREDLSGREVRRLLENLDVDVRESIIIPDEEEVIAKTLIEYSDQKKLDLVITSGGTGLSPRDVTPEATRKVIEREIPGMAEAMRQESSRQTKYAMLSRAVVGARGHTLIINLPGSPKAVRENLLAVLPVIPHAIEKLQGDLRDCGCP